MNLILWIIAAWRAHQRRKEIRTLKSTEQRQVRQAQEQERRRDPWVHTPPSQRPRPLP